jgi:hypothetical protein
MLLRFTAVTLQQIDVVLTVLVKAPSKAKRTTKTLRVLAAIKQVIA